MQKTETPFKPSTDIMVDIMMLQRAIYGKARACGFAKYLPAGGDINVRRLDTTGGWSACIDLHFHPNHGVDYTLTASMTDRHGSLPIDQEALSNAFIAYMKLLNDEAEAIAARRVALRDVALDVIAETASDDFPIEMLRIYSAPIRGLETFDQHARKNEMGPRLWVDLLIPLVYDHGVTREIIVIDAEDPKEFGEYLRYDVLPRLRERLRRHYQSVQAE